MRRPVVLLLLLAPLAGADAAADPPGGAYPSRAAAVATVACRVACADPGTAAPGGVVRVSGRGMDAVRTVTFLGGPGDRDDASVRARRTRSATWVEATVPRRAASGRVRVRNADGNPSPPSTAVLRVGTAATAAPVPGPAPVPAGGRVFPVRGPFTFGGAGAGFGADRGDHAHEGQDVVAACGTPLVAVAAGRVSMRRFQARAGHYVVIDEADGWSSVYMHLRAPALVAQGAAVTAGQAIGAVGDTGVSTGCHLHFERWTAPGWKRGGRPVDPLPALRAWAAASPSG